MIHHELNYTTCQRTSLVAVMGMIQQRKMLSMHKLKIRYRIIKNTFIDQTRSLIDLGQ